MSLAVNALMLRGPFVVKVLASFNQRAGEISCSTVTEKAANIVLKEGEHLRAGVRAWSEAVGRPKRVAAALDIGEADSYPRYRARSRSSGATYDPLDGLKGTRSGSNHCACKGRGSCPLAMPIYDREREGGMPGTNAFPNARGRGATTVTEIPVAGWKDILWRTYQEVNQDRVMLIAAGVTFYGLLALVPAMTALISIYGLVADPVSMNSHIDRLQGLIPSGGLDIIRGQMERLTEKGGTKLGLTSAISILIALWSTNSGMKALFDAMNVAYDEDETRSFLRLTGITLLFTLAALASIIVLSALVVILPPVLALFGFGPGAQWAARLGGFILIFVFLTAGLAALYRWGPSRRAAQWRWITPGALLATFVTTAASALFTWYVASFGTYDATYGSLGAVFGFMTWLWLSATIIIVGAELNAETEHQTASDTTEGRPRPIGRRGAAMADTLGSSRGNAARACHGAINHREIEQGSWFQVAVLALVLWLIRHRGVSRPRQS